MTFGRLLCLALSMIPMGFIRPTVAASVPPSFSWPSLPFDSLETVELGPVDVDSLIAEDAALSGHSAHRVAWPLSVDIALGSTATWERVPTGGEIARLRVRSPGAVFLSFKFSTFHLPLGTQVHFVSENHLYDDGPYDERHHRETGRFGSPAVPGDSAIIEIYRPAGSTEPFALALESVSHGYRNAFGLASVALRSTGESVPPLSALGGAFACQRGINCAEGSAYQLEKHAFAEGYDGQFVCTGQLVNNTAQDGRYLYLTAAHCEFYLDPSTLAFYWNYEDSTCMSTDAPLTFSTGAIDLYHSIWPNDLQLFELNGVDLEGQFDVTYLGWTREGSAPTSSATLGFPDDKPLQIMIDDDSSIDCVSGCGVDSFGSDFWRIDNWEVGHTQGGSSGGALLDQNRRVVGVLTGGVGATCSSFEWDEFYKLAAEWSEIEPFLDPIGTGAISVDTWDGASTPMFIRADVNQDGSVNIADAVAALSLLFGGVGSSSCEETLDANDDDTADISDAVYILSWRFSAGPAAPPPFPNCGSDPTSGSLGCSSFALCP